MWKKSMSTGFDRHLLYLVWYHMSVVKNSGIMNGYFAEVISFGSPIRVMPDQEATPDDIGNERKQRFCPETFLPDYALF